ncbi:U3 snoRNP-associated protein Utp16 [Schizosaccharomyces octosporus yFS286]|uniref:U3 snoRNP-associated protein Utp16 n=1 Tax=Schizosaccharomyces octosporus (strain yFS286) TaxID=483514 RepID=S9RAD7_SCHOY|nr:U3 snoRNP-associated protein Utp16 [Schizosaccharomyces octosporus yFS286]EPX71084.1 U3 snoRNP-associated protein Utp16 [Schizosaccharomyces octosporus yFS286]
MAKLASPNGASALSELGQKKVNNEKKSSPKIKEEIPHQEESESDSDEAPEEVSVKSSSLEAKERLKQLHDHERRLRENEKEKRRAANEKNRQRNATLQEAQKLDLSILEDAAREEEAKDEEDEDDYDTESLEHVPMNNKILFPTEEAPLKRRKNKVIKKGDFKVSVLDASKKDHLAPGSDAKLSQKKRSWLQRQVVPRQNKRRKPLTAGSL